MRVGTHLIQELFDGAKAKRALNNTFMKPSAWCDAVTEGGELEIDRFLVTLEQRLAAPSANSASSASNNAAGRLSRFCKRFR